MTARAKSRLVALGVGAVMLVSTVGCDLTGLGNPTPTAIPTNTAPAPTATKATSEQATPTSGEVNVPTAGPTNTAASNANPTPAQTPEAGVTPSARQALHFADYKLQPTSVNPSLQAYTLNADLSNISNLSDFDLSDGAKSLLTKYDFVAQFPSGDQYKQFYQLYEDGRYGEKPVFVSTDSVLHVYHLMFDKLLRDTETTYLIPHLRGLTNAMVTASQDQYNQLKGTSAENAAKRNLAYFVVAQQLLDPTATIPAEVQTEVNAELKLIEAHAGKSGSPVMIMGNDEPNLDPYAEDYGQYKPRGHYTRSQDLMEYFKAMMWYGRLTFRLQSLDETRSALLMTQALETAKTVKGTPAKQLWDEIYSPTVFFVGGADDLTYMDYKPVMDQALGPNATAKDVADDAAVKKFQELGKSLAGPRINSMFVYVDQDKEQVTKGLRMMGQRFTLDEYAFGQLIWRNVGTRDDTDSTKQRWMPKALDFPAALGSQEAYTILDQMGEVNCQYRCAHYPQQMEKVRNEINSLPNSEWTQNLYWSWLYTFRPLLDAKAPDSGYPSFMTNDAWTRKDLNTVLGSWTELKHDTILYAKQVMAEMGGGPPQIIKGYVEPEPEFYARVAALVGMTRDGLESRGLIEKPADPSADSDYNTLNDLQNLALDLKTISEKELQGQALTDDEYNLIQFYGGRLEHITLLSADKSNEPGNGNLNDQDAAVVADVATGGPGLDQALEEGTGRIMEVYVVVPIEGKLVLTRGGIYSQYEFIQPTGNRLTDEQWRQRLDSGQIPPIGDWKIYISK